MKAFTLFLLLLLTCPLPLEAQSAGLLLQKTTEALSAGEEEYAVSLFRQSVTADAEQAEMFYWTHVNKNDDIVSRLANELIAGYKKLRNYDKTYLFCRELLQRHPDDLLTLQTCAEAQLMRGKEEDACKLYERIISLDADNLQANIFLGNYYFYCTEQARRKLDDDYQKLSTPTRMQTARYRDRLSDLFTNGYSKAKGYLQRVLQLFPSTEAGKTLEKINVIEKEVK